MPLGLGPNAWAETIVQVPTRSFADCAAALPALSASANPAIKEILRSERWFISIPPWFEHFGAARRGSADYDTGAASAPTPIGDAIFGVMSYRWQARMRPPTSRK